MKCSLFSLILGSLLSCSTMVCISQPVQHETSYIQATATARIVNKFLVEAEVVNGGAGYVTSPEVWVNASKGSGALIKAVVKNGAVQKLEILNPGRAYPDEVELIISPPTNRAIAKATIVNGFIVGAEVLESGGGYDSTPVIIVEDDSGNGAELEPIMNHGMVSRIQVANPGANYSQNTVLKINPPDPDLSIEIDESHETKLIMRLFEGMDYWLESAAESLYWTTFVPPLSIGEDGIYTLDISAVNNFRLFRISDLNQREIPEFGKDFELELESGIILEMVWMEPGNFTMGSPPNEQGRTIFEKMHQVTISDGYWIGKYEIKQEEWEAIMGNNPSRFLGAGKKAPVGNISWENAVNFCQTLNRQENTKGNLPDGYEYALPTEAQWEYACRAGTEGPIFTQTKWVSQGIYNTPALDPIAWYGGNSEVNYENGWDVSGWSDKQYNYNFAGTHPAGLKLPNPWGIYDMQGNVWEWCSDWFGDYSEAPIVDPVGQSAGEIRVRRGGAWSSPGVSCRSAYREGLNPTLDGGDDQGFRISLRTR